MEPHILERAERAYRSVKSVCPHRPTIGIITGSGLAVILSKIDGLEISYIKIKGFPLPSVKGHPGVLKINSTVAAVGGRFHAYEGFTAAEVVLPVVLLHRLGVKILILTNAAGGIRDDLSPGDIVLIRDHINLTGLNSLHGFVPEEGGSRFCDMTDAYAQRLRGLARSLQPGLPEGVYAGLLGPSYETPAEIRMLETMGADLVGMSTVLETIAARFLGMEVLGLSVVTNRAAGKGGRALAHEEVIAAGERAGERLAELIGALIARLTGP